jgi:hypothetical protein
LSFIAIPRQASNSSAESGPNIAPGYFFFMFFMRRLARSVMLFWSSSERWLKAFLTACGKDRAGRDWMWFTCNDSTVPWTNSKNAKRLIGLIDAALCATVQEDK